MSRSGGKSSGKCVGLIHRAGFMRRNFVSFLLPTVRAGTI
jgi:hypothetical protein